MKRRGRSTSRVPPRLAEACPLNRFGSAGKFATHVNATSAPFAALISPYVRVVLNGVMAAKSKTTRAGAVHVGIIMGSVSDWKTLAAAAAILDEFGVAYEKNVVSAHRTPHWLAQYAGAAQQRGLQVIIAGAGGAAHLPGMAAAFTTLPVLGVPVESPLLPSAGAGATTGIRLKITLTPQG